MQSVLIIAAIGIMVSFGILVYSFSEDSKSHSTHVRTVDTVNVEDTATVEWAGDAQTYSRLETDNDFIDPSNHCDFCNKIEYSPGEDGKAGLAYKNNKLDLKDYHRIVFFARGQKGGEIVSFIGIGKSIDDSSPSNLDIFPNQHFALVSKNVTLENYWKRYEISLEGTKLEDVTYPFGFVITAHEPQGKEIFYLKGVTFDRDFAQDPLPILT